MRYTEVDAGRTRQSIHPLGQPRERLARKAQNHAKNLQERAEVNRARSHSPLANPTWHGIGRHAGVPRGH